MLGLAGCRPSVTLGSTMKNTGFSLMELVIVVTLFAILLAIATPLLVDTLQAERVRSAVNRFVAAHSLARATAIRNGRTAELHIDASAARFWVEVDTSVAETGVMDTVRTVHDVSDGGMVMTSTRSLLCFNGRGVATSVGACGAGDVLAVFTATGRVDTVSTSPLGKVVR